MGQSGAVNLPPRPPASAASTCGLPSCLPVSPQQRSLGSVKSRGGMSGCTSTHEHTHACTCIHIHVTCDPENCGTPCEEGCWAGDSPVEPTALGLMGPVWLYLAGDAWLAQSLEQGHGSGDKVVPAGMRSTRIASGRGGIEDVDLHRCCSGAERTYDCGSAPPDIPRGDTYGQEGPVGQRICGEWLEAPRARCQV